MVSGVSETKRDFLIFEGDQAIIRDGDAMGIGAKVTQHLVGSAKRWLAIDHPLVAEELTEETLKYPGLSKNLQLPVELEFAGSEGLLQGVGELTAEDLAENCLRKKEVLAPRTNPTRVIRRKTSGGDHAVDMRMMTSSRTIP